MHEFICDQATLVFVLPHGIICDQASYFLCSLWMIEVLHVDMSLFALRNLTLPDCINFPRHTWKYL